MCLNPDRVILSLGVNVRTSSQRPQTAAKMPRFCVGLKAYAEAMLHHQDV